METKFREEGGKLLDPLKQLLTACKECWIVVALPHAGMALVQGLVDRLIDNADPTSRALLQRSTWYVVPNMNPDGNYLGYHRTNRNGINLNRAWGAKTTADSPETAAVEVGGSLSPNCANDFGEPHELSTQ